MKRILIVNVNWLGDVLFTTPFIRTIRKRFPQAYIACMVVPRCGEVLEGNPYVDELVIFDEEGKHSSLLAKMQFVANLKKKRFDTVYLLHRSLTRTLMAALAKIPNRVGYITKKRKLFLTHRIEPPKEPLHRVEYFLGIARAQGLEPEELKYDFYIPQEAFNYIGNFLKENEIEEDEDFVVLNPGANWLLKRWPVENYARVAEEILKKFRYKVIISGAERDLELAREISRLMSSPPIIACGKTNLKQLGALLKKASLVVTNDTGPLHIALAVGTKVLTLFGPTSSRISGPYGPGRYITIQKDVGCQIPCYHLKCQDNRCMKAITPEEVLKEVERLLVVS